VVLFDNYVPTAVRHQQFDITSFTSIFPRSNAAEIPQARRVSAMAKTVARHAEGD
jgi:hypothetical protein